MAYSDIILADNPIAYWKLDEASGTIAADSSGNGHHGTYNGGVLLRDRRLIYQENPVAYFPDSYSFVDIPSHPSLDIGSSPYWTVEAVVSRKNNVGGHAGTVVGKRNSNTAMGYLDNFLLCVDGYQSGLRGDYQASFDGFSKVSGGTSYISSAYDTRPEALSSINKLSYRNRIDHILIIRDGMSMYLYNNGELISAVTLGGTLVSSVAPSGRGFSVSIGAPSVPSSYLLGFSGWIGEVAIYNHALSEEKIHKRANTVVDKYASRVYSWGPSAYWKLNEGLNQNVSYDFSGDIEDLYGGAHNLSWPTPPSNYAPGLRSYSYGSTFSGSEDNVSSRPYFDALDSRIDEAKTIEFIFKHTSSSNDQTIIAQWGTYPYIISIGGTTGAPERINRLIFTLPSSLSSPDIILNTLLVPEVSYHVIITRSIYTSTFYFYINGILDKTATSNFQETTALSPSFYIGNQGAPGKPDLPFEGYLSDIAYYKIFVSPEQAYSAYVGSVSYTTFDADSSIVFPPFSPSLDLGGLLTFPDEIDVVKVELHPDSEGQLIIGRETINAPTPLESRRPSSNVRTKGVNSALIPMTPNVVYLLQVKGVYENLRKAREKKDYVPAQLGGIPGQRAVSDEALVLTVTDFDFN